MITKDFYLAEYIIDTLKLHNIMPVNEFIAVAGRNYGYVDAYKIHGDPPYAVQYGDKERYSYGFTEHPDTVKILLFPEGLNVLDYAIKMANLFGISCISNTAKNEPAPFYVLIARHYRDYIRRTDITDVLRNNDNAPVKFEQLKDARDWIKSAKRLPREFEECRKPIYKVISRTSL